MAHIPVVLTKREEVQEKIKTAANILYDVAKAAYGPGSGNVMLGFRHGPPMLSRDGVTNIKMVRSTDIHVDDAIQSIREASEKNNRKVGDGTTAATILSHDLILASQKLEGKGFKPMEIAKLLKASESKALKWIDSLSIEATEEDLVKVATISANDEGLGQMVADVLKEVGKDGGVIIESYEGLGVHNEVVEGFYFGKGYKDTALINDMQLNQSVHKDVPILMSNKVFSTQTDIQDILDSLLEVDTKDLILIGEVRGEALEMLKLIKNKLRVIPVDPIMTAGATTIFLDDCAVMVGGKVYDGGEFDPSEYLGNAKEVIVTEHSTSILGGDKDAEEVKARIESLHEQLKESDSPLSVMFIKERLARLTGKMAIIKVGGALDFERQEVKLRVQDAVCSVQSAMKEGIVPGGGVTLARISGTDFDEAFKEPFKLLVSNVGRNPEALIAALGDDVWSGYDLRNESDLVNLRDAGVVDATLVIKEIVRNATSVAASLITENVMMSYPDKD